MSSRYCAGADFACVKVAATVWRPCFRYYDSNQFFSDAMLFGRFEAPKSEGEGPITSELFPAYKE
jgi:hypothetical protein